MTKTLRAFLTPTGTFTGDLKCACDALGDRDLFRAFVTCAEQLRNAVLDNDQEALKAVEAAFDLRVALAVRERDEGLPKGIVERLAAIDRALGPHQDALLMSEEDPGDWLRSLREEGVWVDVHSWWGFMASDSWAASAMAVDQAFDLERNERNYADEISPEYDRHESTWERKVLDYYEEWPRWYGDRAVPEWDTGNNCVRYYGHDYFTDYDHPEPQNLTLHEHELREWVEALKALERELKGAEIDWRETHAIPEDFYAF